MASTTLDKKAKEPVVPAARAELAAAIENKRRCAALVISKRESISRALDGEASAAELLEKARANITKALETDVATATTNLEKGRPSVAAWHSASAASSVESAERDLAVAAAVRERLENDLIELEVAAAVAANDVVVARASLLAPIIASTMARVKAARLEILKDRALLATLAADKDGPKFPNDSRAFFRSRECEQARVKAQRAAFGDPRFEADAALAMMPAVGSTEDFNVVTEVWDRWRQKLVRLLDDPTVELPEKI